MLISLLTYLLISNALSLSKDKSILFSRIVMASLTLTSGLAFNNLFTFSLEKGIGVYGGLLHVTTITQSFSIFVLMFIALSVAYVYNKDSLYFIIVPRYNEIYFGLFFSYSLINLFMLAYSLFDFNLLYMFLDSYFLESNFDFDLDTLNMEGNSNKGSQQDSSNSNNDQDQKPKKPKPSFIKIGPETDMEKDLAKIGNCTHDKLGHFRPGASSDVDIIECDFTYSYLNGKPSHHKALTSVNDVAFVCQNCQAIICKDCVNADEYIE